jgi:hypothetical protein
LGIDSTLTPDGVFRTLSSYATNGAITLSAAAADAGTPNKLAFNGHTGWTARGEEFMCLSRRRLCVSEVAVL